MNFDRNTVIGFVLLAVLLFVYLYSSTKNTHQLQAEEERKQDSLALVKRAQDSVAALKDTVGMAAGTAGIDDSVAMAQRIEEDSFVVENDVLRITFTNKGAQPEKVLLKKYVSPDGDPVYLNSTNFDKFSYTLNTGNNQVSQASDIMFDKGVVTTEADSSQSIVFNAHLANGDMVSHQYRLYPNDYKMDWTVVLNGADHLLTQGAFNLTWQDEPLKHESDVKYEREQTNICFSEENDFDYIRSKTEKDFEKPVQWVSVAQQFFNTTLIAKNNFSTGSIRWEREKDDSSNVIAQVTTNLQAKLPLGKVASMPMQLYFGPNDYGILKNQAAGMDKIVNLGRDMYAFVRPINKYIIMPVFNFFASFIGSLGIVIALLTLVIRLLTSPLVYTSYLSGAKMKALRPEIDKLKEKYNGDQQQVGVEQMKLFREAGVNPLGGCIPALLQIPIFFALYSFFNSNIALRGESFLWADNLASYDVIAHFPVSVWGLGDHLSLFTLLAVSTSLLISLYNMNMTPDQGNPAMKYMPYIFPVVLLFVFNRLPAALTWYYTVSNVITLILQFIIQNYIIDHDKILAKLQDNRKKPKSKSKWQERLEQMQEAQKQMQQTRKGGK